VSALSAQATNPLVKKEAGLSPFVFSRIKVKIRGGGVFFHGRAGNEAKEITVQTDGWNKNNYLSVILHFYTLILKWR